MIISACLGCFADCFVGFIPCAPCCGCLWLPPISGSCAGLLCGALEVMCAGPLAIIGGALYGVCTGCAAVADLVGQICG